MRAKHPGQPDSDEAGPDDATIAQTRRVMGIDDVAPPTFATAVTGDDALGAADSHESEDDISLLIEVVRHLPEQTIVDLHRLLDLHLAARPPAQRRQETIGLVLSLMLSWHRVPAESEYREQRELAAARGESWPSVTELAERYGSYLYAAEAAWKLYQQGPAGTRVSSRSLRTSRPVRYTREEVIDAYIHCYETLGDRWPTPAQFEKWSWLSHAVEHAKGGKRQSHGSYPAMQTVTRHLGSHAHAVAEAKRQLLARGQPALEARARPIKPRPRRPRDPRISPR